MAYRNIPPQPVGLPAIDALIVGEAAHPPAEPGWLHEIKQDGWRLLLRTDGDGGLRCLTRGGHDYTWQFGSIARRLSTAGHAVILDGEVAFPDSFGKTAISRLHRAMREQTTEGLVYYAFDLLWLDGRDMRPAPIENRKAALALLLDTVKTGLVCVDHMPGQGPEVFAMAQQLGLEGIVSKKAGSPYVAAAKAKPSSLWVKSICKPQTEEAGQ